MSSSRSKNGFYDKKIRMACIIKQFLDSVFVISGIIKVSVSVISLSLRLRLITLTSTLIIPDITKTSSNNCLLLHNENDDRDDNDSNDNSHDNEVLPTLRTYADSQYSSDNRS